VSVDKPSWRVKFTSPAKEDIKDIFSFIADRDGPDIAETILSRFIQARDSLGKLHDRGRIPPEMRHINVFSYREIQVPPYRVVYQVHQAIQEVHIHIVADGRRNFTELLKKRLLTPTN
jgi:addiction module RelE/StbE family toxin